jgi:hypothetical protein
MILSPDPKALYSSGTIPRDSLSAFATICEGFLSVVIRLVPWDNQLVVLRP